MTQDKTSQETIVQKQLEAYNERNLNKFLSCYTHEIEIFSFDDQVPFITGIEN